LTEQDDVIKLLLIGAPRLGLALGPAPARAGPAGVHGTAVNHRHLAKVRRTTFCASVHSGFSPMTTMR